MIIALVSFIGGRLSEASSDSSMDMDDMKKTLAYAFLYDFPVNVYTENEDYRIFSLLSIKYNDRGNLFFSGTYYSNSVRIKKNFSWREIKRIEINIEKEPEKSIY